MSVLSLKGNDNSLVIAVFRAYHKRYSALLHYDRGGKLENTYDDEETEKLLKFEHGFNKARYKKGRKQLALNPKFSIVKAPHKGAFLPLFPADENQQRTVHYVCGKGGSGKSYLSKQLSHMYAKLGYNVFLVTPVADEAFAGMHVKVGDLVEVNKESDYDKQLEDYNKAKIKLKYKKKELEPEELMELELLMLGLKPKKGKGQKVYKFTKDYYKLIQKPSLWIFDDTEASADQGKLEFLQNAQLLTGRHNDICMIVINHQANNGHRTRHVINESHTYTCFRPMNRYTAYFLKTYMQFTKKQIHKVTEIFQQSRYCTIYKDFNVLLGSHICMSV